MPQITKLAGITLGLLIAGMAGALLLFASAYLYLSPQLPSVETLKDVQLQTPSRIYSADNQLIGEFGEKRRSPITYDEIPVDFVHAILSAEDDRFFSHHGVDIAGLLRAVTQLVLTGEKQSGGSTITMQVARNYFLSFERTFSRKFNEIFLALQIERELSKQEILELYLNKIFLGNRAYGIEAAAQVYYGQSISELNLAQLAMIAGLPKAPSTFNPIINPSRALIRRDWILNRMHELGYIDQKQLKEATNSLITASYHGSKLEFNAPYVAELARQELYERYGNEAYTAGYQVYTTVNANLQLTAQQALVNGLLAYDRRHGYRGPEQQVPADEENAQWLSVLADTPSYGGLVPAIVSAIESKSFKALLAGGEEIEVQWENGLSDFRPFISVNSRGPAPAKAADIVTIGDLIRLKPLAGGAWQFSQLPATQAALVSLNAEDGAILSLVGGFDYYQSKFNRVTQANRQPGSNFKPFLYTAALENGYTPATIINDAPIVFEDQQLESSWRPENSNGKFSGPTRMRQALYLSRNLVSIRILRSVGIATSINYISRFGFNTQQLPKDLSLALGSHSIKPMEVVTAYSVLANGGFKVEPYLINRIQSVNGTVLYQTNPAIACPDCEEESGLTASAKAAIEPELTMEEIIQQQEQASIEALPGNQNRPAEAAEVKLAKRVVDKRTAYIIDDMLRDVVKRGTGRQALSLGRSDLAGKTGTTNGPADAWFSGYGGGIVTTTWLGFDKNELLGRREYGGSAALPIWIDYMKVALKDRPEKIRKQPEGIVSVKIDPVTGLLARPGQRDAIFEIFREENAPREESPDANNNGDAYQNTQLEEDIF